MEFPLLVCHKANSHIQSRILWSKMIRRSSHCPTAEVVRQAAGSSKSKNMASAADSELAMSHSTMFVQRRYWYAYSNLERYVLPGHNLVDRYDTSKYEFNVAPRDKWDYQGVNEKLTSQSVFNNVEDRDQFDGPRQTNETCTEGSYGGHFGNPKKHKKLHEYFDEYTKPGATEHEQKVMAAKAVHEQWGSKFFYYPGEASTRNRPSFRSVPHEILNRHTWYNAFSLFKEMNKCMTLHRNRAQNPMWPPPGYRIAPMETRRRFLFGIEEPGIVTEFERFSWWQCWRDNNLRFGPAEFLAMLLMWYQMYVNAKCSRQHLNIRAMSGNLHYPGRSWLRSYGEPQDWTKGNFYWQEPAETFHNASEFWYWHKMRMGLHELRTTGDAEAEIQAKIEASNEAARHAPRPGQVQTWGTTKRRTELLKPWEIKNHLTNKEISLFKVFGRWDGQDRRTEPRTSETNPKGTWEGMKLRS